MSDQLSEQDHDLLEEDRPHHMNSRRQAKAAEAIRETVSTTILFGLKDPRVKNVTVLTAEASPDLRTAKVYVSVMGTAKQQKLCMYGLESARGFIQSKLAERLQTKNTPVLTFVLDQGIKRSIMTALMLRETTDVEQTESDDEEVDEEDFDEDDFEEDDVDEDEVDDEDEDDEDEETAAEEFSSDEPLSDELDRDEPKIKDPDSRTDEPV